MGMGFDTYHVFKGKGRFPKWLVFITDLIFWAFSIWLVFFVLVKINDGIVRYPIFISIMVGAWTYFLLGSKKYIKLLLSVIRFSKWLYRTGVWLINTMVVRPILLLYKLVWMLISFLISVILTILNFIWKIISFFFAPFIKWGQKIGRKFSKRLRGIWTSAKKWFQWKKRQ